MCRPFGPGSRHEPGAKVPIEPGRMVPSARADGAGTNDPFGPGSLLLRDKRAEWMPLFPLVAEGIYRRMNLHHCIITQNQARKCWSIRAPDNMQMLKYTCTQNQASKGGVQASTGNNALQQKQYLRRRENSYSKKRSIFFTNSDSKQRNICEAGKREGTFYASDRHGPKGA